MLMFTGIITNLGKVLNKTGSQLTIETDKKFVKTLEKGSSAAINGICLTVVSKTVDSFTVEYMPETEKRTNLKYLNINNLVNLELPATPTTFLSGHIVQGHIDGVATLESIVEEGSSHILKFSIPESLFKYIVQKGSITVNGISLTVVGISNNLFTVGIIPHTWKNTSLQNIKVGGVVNVEVDILAKYLERLLQR